MERNGGDGAESESESDGDADAEASADGDESGQHVPQTPPDIGLNLAITRRCCYLFGPPLDSRPPFWTRGVVPTAMAILRL